MTCNSCFKRSTYAGFKSPFKRFFNPARHNCGKYCSAVIPSFNGYTGIPVFSRFPSQRHSLAISSALCKSSVSYICSISGIDKKYLPVIGVTFLSRTVVPCLMADNTFNVS